jgi:hypothetical protein
MDEQEEEETRFSEHHLNYPLYMSRCIKIRGYGFTLVAPLSLHLSSHFDGTM